MLFKKYLNFETELEEILNFNDRLTFILKDSKFISSKNSNFSDVGYINDFKVERVIDFGLNRLHISSTYYYDFNPNLINDHKMKCKIDLSNRINLKKTFIFKKIFENEFLKFYPFLSYYSFFTDIISYFLFENINSKQKKDILQIFYSIKAKYSINLILFANLFIDKKMIVYFSFENFLINYFNLNLGNFNFFIYNNNKVYYGFLFEDMYKRIFYDIYNFSCEFLYFVLGKENNNYILISNNLSNENNFKLLLNQILTSKNFNLDKINENIIIYTKNNINDSNNLESLIDLYCQFVKILKYKTWYYKILY